MNGGTQNLSTDNRGTFYFYFFPCPGMNRKVFEENIAFAFK